MSTAEPNRLLTDADIAERLGCSADKVRRRCRSGEFAHVRIGRDYRFTEADYEAIVATHRREANSTVSNPWGLRRRGGGAKIVTDERTRRRYRQ